MKLTYALLLNAKPQDKPYKLRESRLHVSAGVGLGFEDLQIRLPAGEQPERLSGLARDFENGNLFRLTKHAHALCALIASFGY
jgi:hypothetical protein